jgi:hypothetical protein
MPDRDHAAGSLAPREETSAERGRRLDHEAEMIAKARASVAAGRTRLVEAVTAWVNSWDTDHELPMPFFD